jgi:hypothetical protein
MLRTSLFRPCAAVGLLALVLPLAARAEGAEPSARFDDDVLPVLEQYCYGCHGLGAKKGNVSFDAFDAEPAALGETRLWLAVLKNVRSGLMPPNDRPQPSADERRALETWIKRRAFGIDPGDPDPGRVTLRRLNRAEYRNTIRDLLGVEYNTSEEFPADDSGHGFDNIGDVLTISPLLLEKYLDAARSIVATLRDRGDRRREYFPRDVPDDDQARRALARDRLGRFAARAFRRPADDATKDRLVALAESAWSADGLPFDDGLARAMTAVLASPRFLFREEAPEPNSPDRFPLIDEYSLASRLSYFLWSSMPDDELFRLAEDRTLRAHLDEQVDRMLRDDRSSAFFRNFVGQWLQARDIESVIINGPAVAARDQPADPEADRRRMRFRELIRKDPSELTEDEKREMQEIRAAFRGFSRRFQDAELSGNLRRAMKRETEMTFEYVVREDRPLLELLDSNYTFLNDRLARHYGVEGVEGDRMRRVELPEGSPRGGCSPRAPSSPSPRTPIGPPRSNAACSSSTTSWAHPRRPRRPTSRPWKRPPRRPASATSPSARPWPCTAPTPCAPRATPAWTPSAWPSRTSTPWASGATPSEPARSTPPAG